jgi:hypothetical protein
MSTPGITDTLLRSDPPGRCPGRGFNNRDDVPSGNADRDSPAYRRGKLPAGKTGAGPDPACPPARSRPQATQSAGWLKGEDQ